MGRAHRGSRGDVEFTESQRLKHENQKLKKQIAKLRKELSKLDIDRYSHLKDLIESQDAETAGFDKEHELRQLKDKWICHKCNNDTLRIVIIPRKDGTFYLRRCAGCGNRTKMKKYTDDVDGVFVGEKPVKT